MSQVRTLHQQAMQHLDAANVARMSGNREQARQFTRQAYEIEKQAAELLADTPQHEPTRAILYRSAALLALDCSEPREAERLLAAGLSGNRVRCPRRTTPRLARHRSAPTKCACLLTKWKTLTPSPTHRDCLPRKRGCRPEQGRGCGNARRTRLRPDAGRWERCRGFRPLRFR